jgi:hypothetical protein
MKLNRLIHRIKARKGRTFIIAVTGNDDNELEHDALLAARKCFGPDVTLAVDLDYQVNQNCLNDAAEKKLIALLTVREV